MKAASLILKLLVFGTNLYIPYPLGNKQPHEIKNLSNSLSKRMKYSGNLRMT